MLPKAPVTRTRAELEEAGVGMWPGTIAARRQAAARFRGRAEGIRSQARAGRHPAPRGRPGVPVSSPAKLGYRGCMSMSLRRLRLPAGIALALPLLTLAPLAPRQARADVCPIGGSPRPPSPDDAAPGDDAGETDDAGEPIGLRRRGEPVRQAGGVLVFAASMGGLWVRLRRRRDPR